MKKRTFPTSRGLRGFTLIELLVVIAIIGILASMLLPVLSGVKKRARKAQAQMDVKNIEVAILQYESDNSRYPTTKTTREEAGNANRDFTFGTVETGKLLPMSVDAAGASAPRIENDPPVTRQYSNAEVMAILTDNVQYPDVDNPFNANHALNPKRHPYFEPATLSETDHRSNNEQKQIPNPGLGADLVFRDPFGNPYIITMDMNYDNFCRDAFYRFSAVSTDYSGFTLPESASGPNELVLKKPVMVWSFGPDGAVDGSMSAKLGFNQDNVVNW